MSIDLVESKYDRAERITWWDQSKLLNSKVLVVGAGALANEIVKNLALVGVGHITIVDMDLIEKTNLARCIFFRESDEGSAKSEVLAREAHRLNSDIQTQAFFCSVQELGDGFLEDFNLIIAGLDNREARVWLGSAVRRVGKVWIDGAIEGLMGKVQTFTPKGPCYACTMSEEEWKLLAQRKSCKLLGDDEILAGHTPTNATTSSIIAGVQTQEAIKYLMEMPNLYAIENRVWRMIGEQMSTFFSMVELDENCPFHFDALETKNIVPLPKTLKELWTLTNEEFKSIITFYDEFFLIKGCTKCNVPDCIGWGNLLKKKGRCESCDIELMVDLISDVGFNDEITKLKLNPDLWPLKSLIQFDSVTGSRRHLVFKEKL